MLINLLGLYLKSSGFIRDPHPKSYTRSPPNREGLCFKQSPTVISQIFLSSQAVSEAAVESAGLDQTQCESGMWQWWLFLPVSG